MSNLEEMQTTTQSPPTSRTTNHGCVTIRSIQYGKDAAIYLSQGVQAMEVKSLYLILKLF